MQCVNKHSFWIRIMSSSCRYFIYTLYIRNVHIFPLEERKGLPFLLGAPATILTYLLIHLLIPETDLHSKETEFAVQSTGSIAVRLDSKSPLSHQLHLLEEQGGRLGLKAILQWPRQKQIRSGSRGGNRPPNLHANNRTDLQLCLSLLVCFILPPPCY